MAEQGPLSAAVREPVVVVPYDCQWPVLFAAERDSLLALLPQSFIALEHIGSTAVPDLCAKPIIDILGGVSSMTIVQSIVSPLRTLGYVPASEFTNTVTDHNWFMRWSSGHRTHQLHVVLHGGIHWRQRLLFRDALRSDSKLAQRYAALKRDLASKHRNDRDAYTSGKSEFVLSVARDA